MSDKGNSPMEGGVTERTTRSRSNSPRGDDASPRERRVASRSRSPVARKDNNEGDNDAVNPGNNLYVANLAHRIGQAELEEIFSKYGRLDKCEVIIDPITRESRGFAFVTFEDIRDADDAVNELNGKEIHGRRIRVEHAKRKRGHEKTPGKYLGPRLASTKYGRDGRDSRGGRDRSRDRSRERRRSRSRSRDRGYSRRYDDRDRYERSRYDDRERGRGGYDRERYDGRRSRR